MTDGFTVTVMGVPQAQANIARVSASLGAACLPAAEAGATIVEEDAKRRIRAWPAILSTELLDSIQQEGRSAGASSAEVAVVAGADHAPFVEFGTSFMAAQPFMRPAADENEAPVGAAAAAVFRAAIGL